MLTGEGAWRRRGTGVLQRIDDTWKLAHYNLTVPIPNALLDGVVEQLNAAREK